MKNIKKEMEQLEKNIQRIMKKTDNPYLNQLLETYTQRLNYLNESYKKKNNYLDNLIHYIRENLNNSKLSVIKKQNLTKQLNEIQQHKKE